MEHSLQNKLVKKGRIYSPMQEAKSGSGGWPKKSKLVMEERVATTGSVVEDGSSSPDDNRNDAVGDGLSVINFDSDGDECKV